MNREKIYNQLKKNVQDWNLDEERYHNSLIQHKNDIEAAFIEEEQALAWASLRTSFESMGGGSLCEAASAFLVGDFEMAKKHLIKSFAYERLALRIILTLRLNQDNFTTLFTYNVNEICYLAVLSILFDNHSMLRLCNTILDLVEKYDSQGGFQDMAYKRFIQNLTRVYLNEEFKLEAQNDLYNTIFQTWEDEVYFSGAVDSILDYHLGMACDTKKYYKEQIKPSVKITGYESPFDNIGLKTMPYEVAALYKIRKNNGLYWPIIDHVLWQSPFIEFTENLPKDEYNDNLLEKVNNYYPFETESEILEKVGGFI